MNIIRRENESHLFCEVGIGEVFEYDDSIFMKFEGTTSSEPVYNAICLEDGIITCFLGNEEIRSVNADLIIH